MLRYKSNLIILMVSRVVSPFIMLFALYVIFHGHYSPGGGFQGGTIMAASLLLIRLSAGRDIAQLQFKSILGTPLGSIGVLIYFGTGFAAMLFGGQFLNYHFLPFAGFTAAELRSLGILLVEIGVGLAVMAILVAIYDDLLEGYPYD
ncbi:MAG: MnhB domain-containing protein [Pseudomonadota bacterium]|nr:sodium:proton antiporter [Pseudomonadota bacterium]MBU2026598.1 sodium:proton antiporter [Pseudomonadota bacterium]MBU3932486.1 sodium:proton antiporter [Pseudomonadota bacterium]MBU4073879.1 sodium:proton antiporter [Pseudomonadota bacterium]MBU4120341.1 sodium:proton antiporter [Pseudomonadota bacterium]